MRKVLFTALLGVLVVATQARAQAALQQNPPAPAPATPTAPAQPAAPARPAAAPAVPQPALARATINQQRNVRFDITITDTGVPKPVTKTLSLTVSSSNNAGSIRNLARLGDPTVPITVPSPDGKTSAQVFSVVNVPLNVDVRSVSWVEENAVRASVSVEYQPYVPDAKAQPGLITASATTIFYDGRKTQILQSSDPVSDRRTTIEVTATVVK